MDLEEFNNINELTPSLATTIYSAEQALEYFDAIWYTNTNRRGRWMDLIGDYAGSELFILDGTRFGFCHSPLSDAGYHRRISTSARLG